MDEYNKCYKLSPVEVKEISGDTYAEFFPGENTFDQDMNSLKFQTCNNTTVETAFEAFLKIESELRKYLVVFNWTCPNIFRLESENEIQSNPLKSKEQWQCHQAKACVMPLMAKCVEFGNKCD
ncbi:hypothetical protein TNCT_144642 [Trichonephila clavata]|uniref:Uncharacterized protein n=1 Tax=Trichonephila clavata TaxID=2740835 RepID=A0A8X6K6C9_TRICU|nr:hypothetical protein TNCT_144642 [Trichonephila clavata]